MLYPAPRFNFRTSLMAIHAYTFRSTASARLELERFLTDLRERWKRVNIED
jgi:hypothetical protein